MERVYRWVAGFRMVGQHPYMGFGPGTFYTFYKSYTVRSFQTYVSDNPEHSGIHCQYLMIGVEQGIIGTLIFMALCAVGLLWGEKLLQRLLQKQPTEGGQNRLQLVVTAASSFFIILLLIMVNDLVETDKIGSFFFMNLAWLVNIDLDTKT
jgi:O-antigen ligase